MIKVRVTKGTLAGASSFLALASGLEACAAPTEEATDSTTSGLTLQNPGTGVFSLTWSYGTASGYTFSAQNSVDEYVRVGEKMTFQMPSYYLWEKLYPNDAIPNDLNRLQKIRASFKVSFFKNGVEFGNTSVGTTSFNGTQLYDTQVVSDSFSVAKGTQAMRFSVTITDLDAPGVSTTLDSNNFLEVAVIGGDIPNKTVVFDTDYGKFRQRVLEGGNVVADSQVTLGYTDWRAATLVDSSSLDKNIGTGTSYSRFGSFDMPINGDLQYEISVGFAVDGVWQAEQTLNANTASRLMTMSGRTAYETVIGVPAGAAHVDMYFHVKAFLYVDYNKFSGVKWRRYNQGDRILLTEKWDNLNGKAYADYDFPTETK